MTNTKKCGECNLLKETHQFSKCSKHTDGLQKKCKQCNKKDNLKFRLEINPQHHSKWQRNNPQKLIHLVAKYRKANKGGQIYSIRNLNGDTYIGMTETHLSVRSLEHKQHYKKAERVGVFTLPLLHASFNKYGIQNHTFQTVVKLDGWDRKQLAYVETSFIKSFKEIGKSLNVRDK